MMDTHGYVTDFLCYDNYFMWHNPHWLRYVGATQKKAISTHADFTYCEVGCGHGQTIAVNAASNPEATFYGIDIIEGHYDSMMEYKRLLGIDNFHPIHADIMNPIEQAELPQMDFIVAHGFISWVKPEVVEGLYRFIKNHLKPGGLVMLSYDSLPGCAHREQVANIIQRHMRNEADTQIGIQRGIEHLIWLFNNKSRMFNLMPLLEGEVKGLGTLRDVAHKYGNGVYTGVRFEDVNRDMNDIGLQYAGNVDAHRNYPSLCLSKDVVPNLPTTGTVQREIIMQELLNPPFTISLFHKTMNGSSLNPNSLKMTNALPRGRMTPSGHTPLGNITLNKEIGDKILDTLVDPWSISDTPHDPLMVHTLIALSHYILPVANPNGQQGMDPKPFMEACLRHSNSPVVPVPSAVLGTGVGVPSEVACGILTGSLSTAEAWVKEHDVPWGDKVCKAIAPDIKKYRDHLKHLGAWKR